MAEWRTIRARVLSVLREAPGPLSTPEITRQVRAVDPDRAEASIKTEVNRLEAIGLISRAGRAPRRGVRGPRGYLYEITPMGAEILANPSLPIPASTRIPREKRARRQRPEPMPIRWRDEMLAGRILTIARAATAAYDATVGAPDDPITRTEFGLAVRLLHEAKAILRAVDRIEYVPDEPSSGVLRIRYNNARDSLATAERHLREYPVNETFDLIREAMLLLRDVAARMGRRDPSTR